MYFKGHYGPSIFRIIVGGTAQLPLFSAPLVSREFDERRVPAWTDVLPPPLSCATPAFNAPLLPILLLQLKFDQKLDVRFGSTVRFF